MNELFVFFAGCDVMNTQERERTRRQALSQGLCERVDRGPNGIATTAWQPCACAPSSTSSKED